MSISHLIVKIGEKQRKLKAKKKIKKEMKFPRSSSDKVVEVATGNEISCTDLLQATRHVVRQGVISDI